MSKTAAVAAISTKCGFTNGAAELLLLRILIYKSSYKNTFSWGISSVGRAPALQAGGHEFDSRILHSAISAADKGK